MKTVVRFRVGLSDTILLVHDESIINGMAVGHEFKYDDQLYTIRQIRHCYDIEEFSAVHNIYVFLNSFPSTSTFLSGGQ